MKPRKLTRVIERVRYDTAKAGIIAHNAFWDGSNWERSGRNTFLYRTKNGRYFAVHQTCWQGETDRLEPLTQDAAIDLWESLPCHDDGQGGLLGETSFEDAFPGVELEEA